MPPNRRQKASSLFWSQVRIRESPESLWNHNVPEYNGMSGLCRAEWSRGGRDAVCLAPKRRRLPLGTDAVPYSEPKRQPLPTDGTPVGRRAMALTAAHIHAFHEQGFVVVKGAFPPERILRLRAAIKELCERADEEEQATGQPSFPWQWLDREKRLPARMGDYLQPKKYHSEFGAWMAEDAIPQLEQLCGGPVRHNRFQMLASGGGQPYLQHWHRDWGNSDSIIGVASPKPAEYVDACRGANGKHVEWNTPLLPDEHFLQVVPGSHCRACTDEELACIGAGVCAREREREGGGRRFSLAS